MVCFGKPLRSAPLRDHAAVMTLHWWMHWFWVTALLTLNASSAFAAPQSEELQHITPDAGTETRTAERRGRAMYFPKTSSTTPKPIFVTPNVSEVENQTEKAIEDDTSIAVQQNTSVANITEIVHPSVNWTAAAVADNNTNITDVIQSNMTTDTNLTESQNATFNKKKNLTRPDFVKDDTSIEGLSESRIVTEKPLSLETAYLQTRIPPSVESESYRRVVNDNGMDTGAIAGISFAALVLAALAGSTAFVLYRRRYLNKPQTLNDKCSNPDSSGYLDDSTIRDNSEEMYSLDNDSFLNSLEAMTIQNYWTDTVKHTKL